MSGRREQNVHREIDVHPDPNNCGSCGNDCGADACVDGSCRTDCGTLTQCGNLRVDLDNDPEHCGACNNPCPIDEIRGNGSCERFAPTDCTSCPCNECMNNCCEIDTFVVCAMGECP